MKAGRVEESWFTVTIGGTWEGKRVEKRLEAPGSITTKDVQRGTREFAECLDLVVDMVRVEGPHRCRETVASIRELMKTLVR